MLWHFPPANAINRLSKSIRLFTEKHCEFPYFFFKFIFTYIIFVCVLVCVFLLKAKIIPDR